MTQVDFHEIVRDKIISQMEEENIITNYRILNYQEGFQELLKKLKKDIILLLIIINTKPARELVEEVANILEIILSMIRILDPENQYIITEEESIHNHTVYKIKSLLMKIQYNISAEKNLSYLLQLENCILWLCKTKELPIREVELKRRDKEICHGSFKNRIFLFYAETKTSV